MAIKLKDRNKILDALPREIRKMVKKSYEDLKNKRFSELTKIGKKNLRVVLEKLYWGYNLSLRKIALLFERDYDTIYRWFIKLDIKKRGIREAAALRRNPSRQFLLNSLSLDLRFEIKKCRNEIRSRKVNIPLQLLKKLYIDQKLSTYKISVLFKVSRRTIEKLLQKFGIEARKSIQKRIIDEEERNILLKKVSPHVRKIINKIRQEFEERKSLNLPISSEKISKEILEHLYLKCRLSSKEIGVLFGLSGAKIRKRLQKYDIPRRSISEALTKYPKKPFVENSREMTKLKCYLLGLRCGDLHACLDDRRVVCTVSTTHPAWEELMNRLFKKFGSTRKYPFENRKGRYAWRISAYLDKSFNFLVNRLTKIPLWIANDKQLFLNFLAGLIDSDGTITLKDKNRPCIRIITTSKWLVREIKNILKNFNYHAVIYKKEKHDKTHFGEKPIYSLEVGKKKEVIKLLSSMPFKHEEKIKRALLALNLRKTRLTKAWKRLIDKIEIERTKYQKLAEIGVKSKVFK